MNALKIIPLLFLILLNHGSVNQANTETVVPTNRPPNTALATETPVPSHTPSPTLLSSSTPTPIVVLQSNAGNEILPIALTTLSTIAAAISAVAAMVAIKNERQSAQEAREAKRAFFTIFEPGIKPLPNSPPFRIQINLKNIGLNPASDLVADIFLVEHTLAQRPQFSFNFSVGNLIEYNSPTPWYNDTLHLPNNLPPQFIVMGIRYNDSLLERTFKQIFFMRWDGVATGITHPDFVHVSVDQKNQLINHLREELREFID